MKKRIVYFLLSCSFISSSFAQKNSILQNPKHKEVFRFKFINNTIILPIAVNGTSLNFIIDTGSQVTLLLDSKLIDSLTLKNKRIFTIKGLGKNNDIKAVKSTHNLLQLKSIQLNAVPLFIPITSGIDFSATYGMAIHGMIGAALFKNFIVKINYSSKKITFYDPDYFDKIKCRKCEVLPLTLKNDKPYITIYQQEEKKKTALKMLVDTGGGDAFWIFEDQSNGIYIPKKNIIDFLGVGLNGTIYGKRAKFHQLSIGKYHFKKPIVSFPDSTAIDIKKYLNQGRNGSIGSRVLKRFNVIIDYPNKRFLFKRNKHFKTPFYYNKSGINLIYNGKQIIADTIEKISNKTNDNNDGTASVFTVEIEKVFVFKRVVNYTINHIRKGSPADKVGLQNGDKLISINDKEAYNYSLEKINTILFHKKNISLKIMRAGVLLNFKLILEDEL